MTGARHMLRSVLFACLCVAAMASTAGDTVLTRTSSQLDALHTILRGLQHRADLVQRFEGYVAITTFHGPGSEIQKGKWSPRDLAMTRFYVVDKARDRWLVETRRYSHKAWAADEVTHEVTVLNAGVWGTKPAGQRAWRTATDVESDYCEDLLARHLMITTIPPEAMPDVLRSFTVAEEELDGAKCLRLGFGGELPTQPVTKDYYVFWIDPAKGFAVRKWTCVVTRGGRLAWDHTRHAHNFREYAPGLWLPQKTQSVRCVAPDDDAARTWEELTIVEILEANVNKPLSKDFFAGLLFAEEYPRMAYDAKLLEDDPAEMKREEALLKRLTEGPGDPATFLEPLPELPERWR